MLRFLIKCFLFIVNLILSLLGLAILCIGIAVLLKLDDLIAEYIPAIPIPINLKVISYFVIGVGAVILFIGFCGSCGSVTESKCMLLSYVICMGILAAAKIFVVIQLSTKLDDFKAKVVTSMDNLLDDPATNTTFHALETILGCCGTTGPDSYNYTFNDTSYVPVSCCLNVTLDQDTEFPLCPIEDAFEEGCNDVVSALLEKLGKDSRSVIIYVIVSEGLAIVFALYISCTINKFKY